MESARRTSESKISRKPMKATAANVSRLLTAAGHDKRRAYPSPIRGWKNYTSGFVCKLNEGYVEVRYLVDGNYDPSPDDMRRARVERYLPVLEPHFSCEIVESEKRVFLVNVKERSGTEPSKTCTKIRRFLVWKQTFNLSTGDIKQYDGEEWVTRPCGIPLFEDDHRRTGLCAGCLRGWAHPKNYPAGETPPEVETNR